MEPCTTFFLNFSFSTGKIVLSSFSVLLNYFLEWNIIFVRLFSFSLKLFIFFWLVNKIFFGHVLKMYFFLQLFFYLYFLVHGPKIHLDKIIGNIVSISQTTLLAPPVEKRQSKKSTCDDLFWILFFSNIIQSDSFLYYAVFSRQFFERKQKQTKLFLMRSL